MQIQTTFDTPTYLLEWPKFQTLTVPNAGKDVKQQELFLTLLVGIKIYSHLGRQFGRSYKSKYTLIIRSNYCTPWYLFKGVENLRQHKTCTLILILLIHNFIHNCKSLGSKQEVFQKVNG